MRQALHFFWVTAMNLGQAIKVCRGQRGISRSELARRANCSVSYVSMLESGGRQDPTISTIKSIALALNVPVGILFFLAAEKDELVGLDKDLAGRLAAAALEFLREDTHPSLL
jgi:transcriptional regulator with XRE-family HTH domain